MRSETNMIVLCSKSILFFFLKKKENAHKFECWAIRYGTTI